MHEDVKNKWIRALRSGKYKKGEACLQKGNHYCCLGVLCKLAEQEGVEVIKFDGELNGGMLDVQRAVRYWAGMHSDVGTIFLEKEKRYIELTVLNDKGGSFSEIADIIEENWEKL